MTPVWFGDLKQDMTESASAKYIFYAFEPGMDPYRVEYGSSRNPAVKTEYYTLGHSYGAGSTPVSFAQNYVKGYDFLGWKYYENPVTGTNTVPSNISASPYLTSFDADYSPAAFYAEWQISTNTPYTVVHSFMNTDGTTYSPNYSHNETLNGQTFATTAAAPKSFPGFGAGTATQDKINPDGSTVVFVKYPRLQTSITVNSDGSLHFSDTDYFDKSVSIPVPVKAGYTLTGWNVTLGGTPAGTEASLPRRFPSADAVYDAIWQRNSGSAGGISISFPTYSDSPLAATVTVSPANPKVIIVTVPDGGAGSTISSYLNGSGLALSVGTNQKNLGSYSVGVYELLIIQDIPGQMPKSVTYTITISDDGVGL